MTVKVQSIINGHRTVVVSVVATNAAFAALLADGSVICWGHPKHGGGDTVVTTELHSVRHIAACWNAFAAILEDDTFVCWGNAMFDEIPRPRVKNVQQLHGGGNCFVCVHSNSSVTLWPPATVPVPPI